MNDSMALVGTFSPEEDALRRRVKIELRQRMRAVRRTLPDEARAERSARIWAQVFARPEWHNAQTVMLFVPMRTEVDTNPAAAALWAEGKRVAAPRMTEDGLEIREWRATDEPVETGNMRVPEPPEHAPLILPTEIDLVIVPALVLDERGARIGYGAGLYDRLLPSLTRATRIGVIFDFQFVSEVPETDGDERVHIVVSDKRLIEI
jgi:5-formyltetrahydrofolate cyclo-ligase